MKTQAIKECPISPELPDEEWREFEEPFDDELEPEGGDDDIDFD